LKPETRAVHWKKVTLVGVGLLGGSLGLALKQRRLAATVAGFVRRPASIRDCERFGAVDRATMDLADAVRDADLIVLSTPIAQMRPLAARMLPALKRGAIVTDVGSVKGSVVRELEPLFRKAGVSFIGSHPMAGSEKTGVAFSRADLYAGAVCVVTPTPNSSRTALATVSALWTKLGARVIRLTPRLHDVLVSRSSHLPYLVAASLASYVLDPQRPSHQALLCANGFRDTTRIASGSPEMWRDIAVANRRHVARALDEFIRQLQRVRQEITSGDGAVIEKRLQKAKARRDAWQNLALPSAPE
jgi:prephenate dehydrogenase